MKKLTPFWLILKIILNQKGEQDESTKKIQPGTVQNLEWEYQNVLKPHEIMTKYKDQDLETLLVSNTE